MELDNEPAVEQLWEVVMPIINGLVPGLSSLLSTFHVPPAERSPLLCNFKSYSELLDSYKKIVNFKSTSNDDDDIVDDEEEGEETKVSDKSNKQPKVDLTALSEVINLVTEPKKKDVIVVEDDHNVVLVEAEDAPGMWLS